MKILRQFSIFLFMISMLGMLTSAKRCGHKKQRILPLTSIHLVDRNGLSESISNKNRLNQYLETDFFQPQPYQKILRIYARDSRGNIRAAVHSYYPNENPKQFLEILNGRAHGNYREW